MDTDTKEEGRPCEVRGRDWSDAATRQGMSRIANNYQKPGERHGMDSPSEPPEGTSLADTSVSDF